MKIVVASDQAGYELKEAIKDYLEKKGHEVHDVGTYSKEPVSYAEFSQRAADKIVDGSCERGIVICGAGIGVSLMANKNPGVRCALCTNAYMAELARRHTGANVSPVGGLVLAVTYALTLVDIFMEQEYDGGRHQIRLDQIAEHERSIFRD